MRGQHQVTEMMVGRPAEAGSRAGLQQAPSHLPRLQASSAALRSLGGVLIMPGSSQSSTSGSPLSQRPASFLPHSSRLEEGRVVTSAGRAPWAAGWGSWMMQGRVAAACVLHAASNCAAFEEGLQARSRVLLPSLNDTHRRPPPREAGAGIRCDGAYCAGRPPTGAQN